MNDADKIILFNKTKSLIDDKLPNVTLDIALQHGPSTFRVTNHNVKPTDSRYVRNFDDISMVYGFITGMLY
jgi:hypothetical protein